MALTAQQPNPTRLHTAGIGDETGVAGRDRSGWRDLTTQALLIGLAALLYFAVRGVTEADPAIAVEHGKHLLGLENRVGLDAEATLQRHVVDKRWLITAVNWIYIWGHWPAIAGTLIWLQRTRRVEFLRLRNALFISGAIGLVIFALYPVAPPRLLGNDQLVDTVSQYSTSYRILQPPALVNKYAALPSLHVGWNLLIGLFVWRHATRRPARYLGAISPALMIAAVVLTANHYLVDAAAGAAIALAGLALATKLVESRNEHSRATRRLNGTIRANNSELSSGKVRTDLVRFVGHLRPRRRTAQARYRAAGGTNPHLPGRPI